MRYTLENEVLTLFFEGELNSYNSEDVENEIEGITKNGGFKSIVIDMENLKYISSAGLRIIVRLKQLTEDVSFKKVNSDVYEIFEMVGFQNLFDIERLN